MSRYKAYSEYKNSEIKWLGEVPKNWDIKRIKFIARINPPKSELSSLEKDMYVSFLPMECIGEQGELDLSNKKQLCEVLNGYSYLAENDIALAKITPCFENGKAAVIKNVCNNIAFATTEVITIRCFHKSSIKFLFYLLKSSPFKNMAEGSMYGAGGQKRVADSFVANYHFSLPTNKEQQKIADFLDYETSKIDQLINKQKALIELLKEKRQALISQAVTKGLNPHVKMKDSGIEWLGEVPGHWEIKPLKRIGYILSGYAFDSSLFITEGIRVLKIANIQTLKLDWTDESFIDSKYYERLKNFALLDGDIVFALTRPIISTGIKAAIVHIKDEKILLNQRNACLRFFKGFYKEYFYYVLFSQYFLVQFENSIDATGQQPNISPIDIGNLKILCPPYAEQKAIYEYLRCKISDMDVLMEKATKAVSLLQERRTALISAAVTGKIDVRNWQSPNTVDTMTNITPN